MPGTGIEPGTLDGVNSVRLGGLHIIYYINHIIRNVKIIYILSLKRILEYNQNYFPINFIMYLYYMKYIIYKLNWHNFIKIRTVIIPLSLYHPYCSNILLLLSLLLLLQCMARLHNLKMILWYYFISLYYIRQYLLTLQKIPQIKTISIISKPNIPLISLI